jgi:hypothetical protein
MKLVQALDEIGRLKGDEVIFARKPWDMNSDASIGQLDSDFRVPGAIADLGYEYFIDAPVAAEVLDVLAGRRSTPQERRELLLYYAVNDAYPDWVHQR